VESGQGEFVLDYLTRYSSDHSAITTLLDSSPGDITAYLSATRSPGSPFSRLPGPQGLQLRSSTVFMSDGWLSYVPNPYRASVESAFQGRPQALTTTQRLTLYRYWGNTSMESGSPWYSLDGTMDPATVRAMLALPDGNSAVRVSKYTIPADSIYSNR
jgi:hypothetical protein